MVSPEPVLHKIFQLLHHFIMNIIQWHAQLKLWIVFRQQLIIYIFMEGIYVIYAIFYVFIFSLCQLHISWFHVITALTVPWVISISEHTDCSVAADIQVAEIFLRQVDWWDSFFFYYLRNVLCCLHVQGLSQNAWRGYGLSRVFPVLAGVLCTKLPFFSQFFMCIVNAWR